MKAVAVGDLLLPASVFDETIRSASWVTAYDSFDWDVTKKRDELRNVVRRMETAVPARSCPRRRSWSV